MAVQDASRARARWSEAGLPRRTLSASSRAVTCRLQRRPRAADRCRPAPRPMSATGRRPRRRRGARGWRPRRASSRAAERRARRRPRAARGSRRCGTSSGPAPRFVITSSARPAPGDPSPTVTSAVVAPEARAARIASFVSMRAALVRDREKESVADRPAKHLEGLDHADLTPGRRVERLAEQRGDPHRGVLGRAAAGGEDRLARRQPPRGSRRPAVATMSSVASRCTRRSASAGSAAIISLIRYGGLPRNGGIARRRPRLGRTGQRVARRVRHRSSEGRLQDHERHDSRDARRPRRRARQRPDLDMPRAGPA